MVADVDPGRESDVALKEIRSIQEAVGLTIVETVAQELQHILAGLGHFIPDLFLQRADLGDESFHALDFVTLTGHGGGLEDRLVLERGQESRELFDELGQQVHDLAIGDVLYQTRDVGGYVHKVVLLLVGIRQ